MSKGIKRQGRSNGVPRECRDLLEQNGYVLARADRHFIYKRASDNTTIVVSVSPSDPSSEIHHVRRDIRRHNRARDAALQQAS